MKHEGIEHPRTFGTGSVRLKAGRYHAQIRSKHVGTFATEDEAHAALDAIIEAGDIPERAPAHARSAPTVERADSLAITAYLTALKHGRQMKYVQLGALGKGFPQATDDPAMVRKAIDHIELRAAKEAPLFALRSQQRIIELRRSLAMLEDGSPVDRFIECAAAYGEANSIEYGAWRAVGVPAAVLKQAGIRK